MAQNSGGINVFGWNSHGSLRLWWGDLLHAHLQCALVPNAHSHRHFFHTNDTCCRNRGNQPVNTRISKLVLSRNNRPRYIGLLLVRCTNYKGDEGMGLTSNIWGPHCACWAIGSYGPNLRLCITTASTRTWKSCAASLCSFSTRRLWGACVPGMAQNQRGESPCARYSRSRRPGEGQGRHREMRSGGSPIQKRGATYRNRI